MEERGRREGERERGTGQEIEASNRFAFICL